MATRAKRDRVVVRMDGARYIGKATPAVLGFEKLNQADIDATWVERIHTDRIVVAALEADQA